MDFEGREEVVDAANDKGITASMFSPSGSSQVSKDTYKNFILFLVRLASETG